MIALRAAAMAIKGQFVNIEEKDQAKGVSTDTRSIKKGTVFIALAGPRFNGHDYLETAFERGAIAAIISNPSLILHHPGKKFILVTDTLIGLQELAAWYRRQFPKLKVIAVTGSNGKTTVKNLIAAAVGQKYKTLRTQGNLNNHIGLPLTLLRLDKSYDAAVVEMGMNNAGEIDRLAQITCPAIGVITNIGPAHMAAFESIAKVRSAKSELIGRLGANGIAILNGDDKNSAPLVRKGKGKVNTFGRKGDTVIITDVIERGAKGILVSLTAKGKAIQIATRLIGAHQAINIAATVTAALAIGVPLAKIAKGIEQVKPVPGRMTAIKLKNGALLVDDSYNANPASVAAALDAVAGMSADLKIFLFGSMEELGEQSVPMHEKIGTLAVAAGIDLLITCGAKAAAAATSAQKRGGTVQITDTAEKGAEAILNAGIGKGTLILVKGSRSVGLDQAVTLLRKEKGR